MIQRIINTVGMTVTSIFAAAAPNAIEEHTVSLGTVCAVGGVVLPFAWWLSRKFTSIDEQLKEQQRRMTEADLNREKHTEALTRLTLAIGDLPCHGRPGEICHDPRKSKNP